MINVRIQQEAEEPSKPKRLLIEAFGITTEDAIAHAISVITGILRGSTDCKSGDAGGSASGKVSDV